jgi:uncharacterized repeat protein (TIGR02543 family)
MKMKRFSGSGATLCAALFAVALLALAPAGCSNPGDGDTTPFLVGIAAETTKTVYLQGQDLDLGSVLVTGTYSDGTTESIPITGANVPGYNKAQAGNQTVTVTVDGISATFSVTVLAADDTAAAKEALNTALDAALESVAEIAESQNAGNVPEGVKWVAPAQKAALNAALEEVRQLAASADPDLEAIVEALDALQEAAKAVAAAAETQTGTKAEWSYTVAFDNNYAGGGEPVVKEVANPATTVDSLPAAPARSGYTFSGWNTRQNGAGSVFIASTPVVANISVYAQWTVVVNAQTPRITAQPRSAAYLAGQAATPLSVAATSPDGGELSYQWHSRASGDDPWTAISGATTAIYTPPTAEAGAVSYYVEAVNTRNDVNGTKTAAANSATATITVTVINAQAPNITAQPRDAAYNVGQTATALTVTAASRDGGELSYQWHSRASGDDPWTAISGATGTSHTPSTAAAGIVSYYVEVVNTNNSLSGVKTAAADSATATITVTVVNAQAPNISAQPQAGTYVRNAAATLTVAADSPDGGTLSYQWHSSAASGGQGTAISGATAASYVPPTAALGTVYYYVRIVNTNNSLSGTKTAAVDSSEAAVAVIPVSAQAPAISVQPQNGAYNVGVTATALSVTAATSDGGTLSDQWHRRAGSNAAEPISGATTASYTPPTTAVGTVYYYVAVANTNNAVEGEKTTTTRSREAKIMTEVGMGSFSFVVWANDDYTLVSDMPANLSISREAQESLVISAADDLDGIQWSINGADLAAPRGTAQFIAIEAANYGGGTHTLGLRAEKDQEGVQVPYSISITFTVVN